MMHSQKRTFVSHQRSIDQKEILHDKVSFLHTHVQNLLNAVSSVLHQIKKKIIVEVKFYYFCGPETVISASANWLRNLAYISVGTFEIRHNFRRGNVAVHEEKKIVITYRRDDQPIKEWSPLSKLEWKKFLYSRTNDTHTENS